jgi:cysteine desulfurase/selenocysteine lyase
MTNQISTKDYRNLFVGLDAEVPLLNGQHTRYINFDNAASTPALKSSQIAVNDFLTYYSSVHRGTGFKSQLSTYIYEETRDTVLRFVGANPITHTCIFGKNTTEAINKLARRIPIDETRDIVLTSGMEHHSNDLPWRAVAKTVHIKLTPNGCLDEDDFDQQLKNYGDRIALVAVTGASNVTGNINPIHRLAEKTHAVGAQILVDCAQLAPHRKINMRSLNDPGHLDYVTISAHKMYAPFGSGALIGRRDNFERGAPDQRGGGTVEIVTLDSVVWAGPPERDEAGSPNTVGAVALAAAINQLEVIDMHKVAEHETLLIQSALEQMRAIPNLVLYGGNCSSQHEDRLGVIPFLIKDINHFLVAAILGYEFGIGVRNGCFCAHPYILHLLGLSAEKAKAVRDQMLAGDRSSMPGLIRVSFGLYNTLDEVEILVEALNKIARGEYQGEYAQHKQTGEFTPHGWTPEFENYFSLKAIDNVSLG